jgi:archaellum component FlaG (FlaF/FlaG flagellin family)
MILQAPALRPRSAVLFAATILAGCQRDKSAELWETKEEFVADVEKIKADSRSREAFTPPAEPTAVELEAKAGGARLNVVVRNVGAGVLILGPRNFGLLADGAQQPVSFPSIASQFPIVRLEPGGTVAGILAFGDGRPLPAGWLVFSHPDSSAARTRIQ